MAIGGSGKGIQIVVGTDYNDRDLKRAQADLNRLKGQAAKTAGPMAKLGNTLRANVGPALAAAGAAAAALAIKFAVDGVRAAAEEEAALAKLSTALDNVGQGFAEVQVNAFIDDLQRASGVADDELRPAFQRLVTATRDAAEAQDLLSLALDISVGTGKSLESVSLALAKAATGQASSLRRLGVPLSDAAVKSGDLGAITKELSDSFGGQAAAAAKTFEGQLKRLGVAFGELQESFGKGFLDALGDTNDGTDGLMDAFQELEPIAYSVGESIGTLAKFMADLEKNTGLVVPVVKALTDLLGPTTDAILMAYRVFGQGEDPMDAFKSQMLGITDETEAGEKATGAYWRTVLKATGAKQDALSPTDELIGKLEEEAEAAEKAAEEFDKLSEAISRTGAVKSYQAAQDDLRKTLKENNNQTSIFNNKGRESVDAYVDLAKSAGDYIESLDSTAQKASAARGVLDTLTQQLGKTKMDPQTQAALLAPFQGLIDDLREANVDVSGLQAQLDALKSKTITVTTEYRFTGSTKRDTQEYPASGGLITGRRSLGRGSDTVPAMLTPGEFVVRRQAVSRFGADLFSQLNRGINPLAGMSPTGAGRAGGFQIGTINVVAAPGERAETSLPRALRRAAFLAGVNG